MRTLVLSAVLSAVVGLVSADVLQFRRRAVPEKGLRALGFVLLLVVAAGLVQKFAAELSQSPPVGSGGYIGALAVTFLEGQFGPAADGERLGIQLLPAPHHGQAVRPRGYLQPAHLGRSQDHPGFAAEFGNFGCEPLKMFLRLRCCR